MTLEFSLEKLVDWRSRVFSQNSSRIAVCSNVQRYCCCREICVMKYLKQERIDTGFDQIRCPDYYFVHFVFNLLVVNAEE